MKKVFFSAAMCIFSYSLSTGQVESGGKVQQFIRSHFGGYNEGQKIIFCGNLDSLTGVLEKKQLSYRRAVFYFSGKELDAKMSTSGGAKSITLDKHKPFIYYTTEENVGGLIITVVSGHNGW